MNKLQNKVLVWFQNQMSTKFPQSEWVTARDGRAYIRHQNYGDKLLTIANITITHKRRGTFKSLLKEVEALAAQHGYNVVIECVHNEHLYTYLLTQGYNTRAHRDPTTLVRTTERNCNG